MREHRIGLGYDVHRLGGEGPVVLCGVAIDHPTGLEGTSDGDVATHAVCDAILGAAALGDLGMHFPSDDGQWLDADSLDIARRCISMVHDRGFELVNVDVTIIAQSLRIAPHRDDMRQKLAGGVLSQPSVISVKATTTDTLGFIGRDEGVAAMAIVTLNR